VPIASLGASSSRACGTCPTVPTVHDVGVLIANVGASSNRTCATCPTVAMGEVRPLLLGHHSSDGTAMVGHLPVATECYGPLLQRRIVVVFISNLASKIYSFLPLVRLKHENKFIWGEEQREAFDKIKRYLTLPPMLKPPRIGKGFKLYVAAEDHVIGAMLTQEDKGKEFRVAYLSRRLVDTETMYSIIEELCLALYYACMKC
jgi:hypothetical protein